MSKYRKKAVVIEAMQLPQLNQDPSDALTDWLRARAHKDWESGRDGTLLIHTLEGTMTASPGDWIIEGVKGELYPCKPDIFVATYEIAE